MDLFDYMREQNMEKEAPLASRLRPTTLEEVVGQQHIIGKDKLLYRAIKADKLSSVIFYGPPGTGKTTLAKVIANTTSANFTQINATVAGKPALDLITEDWYVNELIPTVAKRGSAIIQARGHSSAASAANAAIDHIHDWVLGSNGEWATMAVPSDGSYGIPEGLTFGMPVICKDGDYEIVKGLELNQFQKDHIAANIRALEEERAIVDEIIAKT